MAKLVEAEPVSDAIPLASFEEEELKTSLSNWTSKPLTTKILDAQFWVGRPTSWLFRISPGYYGVPTQAGILPAGVKWGISYFDGEDSTARKWIVAFDTQAQKAYAEAGPTGPVDWDVVEVKLGLSTNKSEYVDPILGGHCIAEIDGFNASAIFYG